METRIELMEAAPFKSLAVRTGITPDKSGTRTAWSKLTAAVPLDDKRLVEGQQAYVFIPQAQWQGEVDTLWVGLHVHEFGEAIDGVVRLDIGGGLCISAEVDGDEAHMWGVYNAVFGWLERSPDYELDTGEGVLGMETVPLEPLNPLTVPYASLQTFHFRMLYPVRRKTRKS